MQSSLFGGWYNRQTNKRWKWRAKLKSYIFLKVGSCKISTQTVRNGVIDVKCNTATRMGFKPMKLEETIARERLDGVRDVL